MPTQYDGLIDIADHSSKHLSGDFITDAIESLQKESKMKAQLKKGPGLLGKRKHSAFLQHWSNYKASSKTQKRTQDQGHSVKRSNQYQTHKNNNQNNTYNRHSNTKKDNYHQSTNWKPEKH